MPTPVTAAPSVARSSASSAMAWRSSSTIGSLARGPAKVAIRSSLIAARQQVHNRRRPTHPVDQLRPWPWVPAEAEQGDVHPGRIDPPASHTMPIAQGPSDARRTGACRRARPDGEVEIVLRRRPVVEAGKAELLGHSLAPSPWSIRTWLVGMIAKGARLVERPPLAPRTPHVAPSLRTSAMTLDFGLAGSPHLVTGANSGIAGRPLSPVRSRSYPRGVPKGAAQGRDP